MRKGHVTTHTGEGRTGLVNADPGHAPGKQHINLEEISTRLPAGDPREYESRIPIENRIVRKQRTRRGR